MAIRNLSSFTRLMTQAKKRLTGDQVILFQRKLALDALTRIVQKTPIDTGRARGNWQLTINESPSSEKFSADPIGVGIAALANLPRYAKVFITNNVPYIKYLEEGSSSQAPNGMVAITLDELSRIEFT